MAIGIARIGRFNRLLIGGRCVRMEALRQILSNWRLKGEHGASGLAGRAVERRLAIFQPPADPNDPCG